MQHIRKKLNSRDGVTILIALVGFLVAAMVAVVIVTAAVSSAERVADDRTTTQNRLTLESAAVLVRDEVAGTTYTFKKTDGKLDSASAVIPPADGMFNTELKAAIEAVNTTGGDFNSSTSADFQVSFTPADSDSSPVKVTFVMTNASDILTVSPENYDEGRYDLTFTFTMEGTDQKLYLTMDGSCKADHAKGTYTISWKAVSINELGA